MVHVQAAHMINIYDLSTETVANGSENIQGGEKMSSSQKEMVNGVKEVQTSGIAMNGGNQIQVQASAGVILTDSPMNGAVSDISSLLTI